MCAQRVFLGQAKIKQVLRELALRSLNPNSELAKPGSADLDQQRLRRFEAHGEITKSLADQIGARERRPLRK